MLRTVSILIPKRSQVIVTTRCVSTIKEALKKNIATEREKVKNFRKAHGKTKIGEINVDMLYMGMRGMKAMVWETSELDVEEGIRYRNLQIEDCYQKLPKAANSKSPLPESVFWLLLTGEIPTAEEIHELSREWAGRAHAPAYAIDLIKSFPTDVHPMAQLSAVSAILDTQSHFVRSYALGVHKMDYWDSVFEDCMNLIAQLPVLAATIYRRVYKGDEYKVTKSEVSKDWAHNFALMLGYTDAEFIDMLRLYLVLHCDHEGGNVSAHSTHLVGSALSSPFLAYAAGMNGLAGPLHGLANQEVLQWMLLFLKQHNNTYTEQQLQDYIHATLKSGKVIPGFGHAVLRKTDPRYTCFQKFGNENFKDDLIFKLSKDMNKVVPPILTKLGKVKNPWPNVDAISGVMLYHYGMKETEFYTVMFGVSRALGILASLIWSRALMFPIERPKSMSTYTLMKILSGK